VELLRTYADLVEWSIHVGTHTPDDAHALHTAARQTPTEAEQVLGRARELREALYRLFTAVASDAPPSSSDLALLNAALAAALPHRCLTVDGTAVTWRWEELSATLESPLWPVALSAAHLLTAPERSRIGLCAAERCGWLFLDTSKSGRRRWCSMESCGNRAKARRHYQRQRAAGSH
jgi:predicted RNA-binding Zn ribbon-like protein